MGYHPIARAEAVTLDTQLVQCAKVKVAEGRVVFRVVSHVALMLVGAAGKDDGQVLASVRGGVAQV